MKAQKINHLKSTGYNRYKTTGLVLGSLDAKLTKINN